MHRKTNACKDCGKPIVGGKTLYCQRHVMSHLGPTKWKWSAEHDAILRDGYRYCRKGKTTRAIDRVQAATGYPRYVIKMRAQKLGIARATRRTWSLKEDQFIRDNLGKLSAKRMAMELHRSHESVSCRIQRLGMDARVTAGYTMMELAELLGCTGHQIRKWIMSGRLTLNADRRVPEAAVRRFLVCYLDSIDLRQADQRWLKLKLNALLSRSLAWADRSAA